MQLQASPVKQLAEKLGLPVLQPNRAREEAFINILRELHADLMVVVAYGQILPQSILDLPGHGCLNIHGSLLPKYRGAAPIQWAIAEGEAETGVGIMKMDAGLDTGPVLAEAMTPITPQDDAPALIQRLSVMGAELLVKTIPEWVAGRIQPRPQPAEGSTYAAKIKKEHGAVDWSRPAVEIERRLRAFLPWPGAFTFAPGADRPQLLKLWKLQVVEGTGPAGQVLTADRSGIVVGCGQQAVRILELQREGGKRQTAEQFLSGGNPLLKPGMMLVKAQ